MGETNEIREPTFSPLKLPISHTKSPDHHRYPSSGISTPPLQTPVSIPFRWEQEPGKPRPETRARARPGPARCLELPPCRITKTPSPSSALDGPYNAGRPKFSSFRLFNRDGPDPFDGYSSASTPSEGTPLGVLLGGKKSDRKGFFGKFKGGKKEGSFGFSPSFSSCSCESEERGGRVENSDGEKMRRHGSFSSVSHAKSSHIWATIYQGFKQVIQWKSSKKAHIKEAKIECL